MLVIVLYFQGYVLVKRQICRMMGRRPKKLHEKIINEYEKIMEIDSKFRLLGIAEMPVKEVCFEMISKDETKGYQKFTMNTKSGMGNVGENQFSFIPFLGQKSCTINYILDMDSNLLSSKDFDLLVNKLNMLLHQKKLQKSKNLRFAIRPTDINQDLFEDIIAKIVNCTNVNETTRLFEEFLLLLKDLLDVYPLELQLARRKNFMCLFILCRKLCDVLIEELSKND